MSAAVIQSKLNCRWVSLNGWYGRCNTAYERRDLSKRARSENDFKVHVYRTLNITDLVFEIKLVICLSAVVNACNQVRKVELRRTAVIIEGNGICAPVVSDQVCLNHFLHWPGDTETWEVRNLITARIIDFWHDWWAIVEDERDGIRSGDPNDSNVCWEPLRVRVGVDWAYSS